MPLYTYQCKKCGMKVEHLVAISVRDKIKAVCPACDGKLKRIIDGAPALHGEGYQMKAVLGDGTHVAGHFGKSAPLVRKKK